MLKVIVYICSANGSMSKEKLIQMKDDCLVKSKEYNLTGFMIYHDGTFLQVIEGEGKNVSLILNAQRRNDDFKNIMILLEDEIESRDFEMCEFSFQTTGKDPLKGVISFDDLNFEDTVEKGSARMILKSYYENHIKNK